MATFFGEVILPSSRVFFDDSDDEDEPSSSRDDSARLVVKELVSGSLGAESDLLILVEGNVARGFASYHLLGEEAQLEPLVEIELDVDKRSDEFPKSRTEPSALYKINNSTRLLDVSPSIDILLSNSFTVLIQPALKAAKKLLVLCSRPSTEFRCDSANDLPSAFLRVLTTSTWTEALVHRNVEQPNFLSGLPASIVTWAEASRRPCAAVVCFTDTDKAESVTVHPLVNYFGSGNLALLLRPIRGPVIYKKPNKVARQESSMYL